MDKIHHNLLYWDTPGDFGTDFPQYSWRLAVTDTELSSFKKIEVTVMNKAFVSGGKYTLVLYKATGN